MNIDGVNNGIVLDHIQAGKSMKIYELLGLDKVKSCVAIVQNVKSDKYGYKDIIKIDEVIDLNFDVLGYVDPGITVCIVKDGKLDRKFTVGLPERVTNVIRCRNPRCITTVEPEIPHIFKLTDRENRVYRCIYCESRAKNRD